MNLKKYNNDWFNPGGNAIKRVLWYFTNALFFTNHLFPISKLKVILLRLFGAKVGIGVNIKPAVNIKYPWNLKIGNYSWIGEEVWIDNLVPVSIGSNCCISQGALLLCGNHNYKMDTFDLIAKPINIEDGVWIGAKSVVCPGITAHADSILTVGSVATTDLLSNTIYQGIPASAKRERTSPKQKICKTGLIK